MDVFIGGGGDSFSRIVACYQEAFAAANPGRKSLYFRRGKRREALAAIRAVASVDSKEPINLVGHSYGGAVAVWLSRQLAREGIDVDLLVTIDPVSRAWKKQPGIARQWINVNAQPAAFNGLDGDAWALVGGKWGVWPRGRASSCRDAPFHHNEFGKMLEWVDAGGASALQALLQNATRPA